jgi:hypothetical protein
MRVYAIFWMALFTLIAAATAVLIAKADFSARYPFPACGDWIISGGPKGGPFHPRSTRVKSRADGPATASACAEPSRLYLIADPK